MDECVKGKVEKLFKPRQANPHMIEINEQAKQSAAILLGIPTGFRPKAQGCAARATLGKRPTNISNRNAVAAILFVVARHSPQPPCGWFSFCPVTQGSLASSSTLG
jgi:hypothetical protein